MSVLGQAQIIRRLKMKPHDLSALVITPLSREGNKDFDPIDYDSVDLRLGYRFLLPRIHSTEVVENVQTSREDYYKSVETVNIPYNESIVVPAHGTVLGSTLEYLKLPYDIAGEVLTRSSLARRFITIETAPWIHPLYRGCLTLEIANASNTPIKLKPGTYIGQLILFEVLGARKPKRDVVESTYLGPVHPELPLRLE